VILAWWKLKDTIADEAFIKSIPYRILHIIMSGAYKKAARDFPEFDGRVKDEIAALTEYESRSVKSLDGASDKFAQMLRAAAPESMPDKKRRPMLELLYHLGRWIYIIDACDDYRSDVKNGRFNPVASLYPPEKGVLPDESAVRLRTTINHSNNLLGAAFELLPVNIWTPTVANIIYMGMPDVCTMVFEGSHKKKRNGINE